MTTQAIEAEAVEAAALDHVGIEREHSFFRSIREEFAGEFSNPCF